MSRLLVFRLTAAAWTLLLISVLAFGLVHMVPGNAAEAIVGTADREAIIEVEERLGLDRPILEQYFTWLGGAVQGDFGVALVSDRGQDVTGLILARLPATAALVGGALTIALSLGIATGMLAALRPGGLLDRLLTLLTSIWLAVPGFLVAMLTARWLGAEWGLFPVLGLPSLTEDPVKWLHSLVLPATALALGPTAIVARQMRGALIDVLRQDYIRTAQACGVKRNRIVLTHALKNAMVPVSGVVGFQVAFVLGTTVLVEQVFVIPGLGDLGVRAVLDQDMPIVQGYVVVLSFAVVVVNLLADFSLGFFNPKIRSS